MENQTYCIRTWVPWKKPESYTQTIWIYDGGDKQGLLWYTPEGKAVWTLCQIQSRGYIQDGCIQETGFLTSEIPLHFFSIEPYPASIQRVGQSLQISIPSWVLLESQCALDSPAQNELHQPSPQPQSPLPLRQPQQFQRSLPAPERLPSGKQGQSQRILNNTKNNAPRPTSSPSSNPTSRAKRPQPNPRMPVPHRLQPGVASQTEQPKKPSLPQKSLQTSPSSQHPPKQSSESGKLTSVSPGQTFPEEH